jgi:hypothetical protein
MEQLTYDDFKAMAHTSRRAFHLELSDTYNVASEDEPFGKWQRGEPDDYAWHQDWLRFLREATSAGIRVQRVRVVSVPHSDYTLFGLAIGRLNTEAGEAWLRQALKVRDQVWELAIPYAAYVGLTRAP